MTEVIMHGCNGKMGQIIAGLIAATNTNGQLNHNFICEDFLSKAQNIDERLSGCTKDNAAGTAVELRNFIGSEQFEDFDFLFRRENNSVLICEIGHVYFTPSFILTILL